MNILIVGNSGMGKSNMADLLRNGIFKADREAAIKIDDADRVAKAMGNGKNEYSIVVRQQATKEDEDRADVVVEIKSKAFIDKFKELY